MLDQSFNKDMSIIELLNQYFREKPLSPVTITGYKRVVKQFTDNTKIKYISEVEFDKLLDWRTEVIKRTSDISWNSYLRHMRAIWRFAVKNGYTETDHFSRLNWGKYKKARKKTIEMRDIKKIFNYLSSDNNAFEYTWFWDTVVRTLFYTGIRRRQLVLMRWSDLDFQNKTLYLSNKSEKNDSDRKIPIQDQLLDSLYLFRESMLNKHTNAVRPFEQIFNINLLRSEGSNNKEMSVMQLSSFLKRLGKKTGTIVSAHRFRHTMATEIAKTGKIKHLQEILGHRNIRTTLEFYVHPDQDELKKAINTLPIF